VSTSQIQGPNENGFVRFAEAHPNVITSLDEIATAYGGLFEAIQAIHCKTKARLERQKALFILTCACYGEFNEVAALATTGLGGGATKLLRALTERVTTTLYLMKHQRQIRRFKDYSAIHDYKLLVEIERLRIKKPKRFFTHRERIVQRYESVKRSFDRAPCRRCAEKLPTLCKSCQNSLTRAISWTPLSVPDMADKVGQQLRKLFAMAYSVPMFYLHASDWSLQQQMSPGADGVPFFQHPDKEWKDSHSALVIGCALIELLARRANSFYRLKRADECKRILNASTVIRDEFRFGKRTNTRKPRAARQ
jgi:hypothetical protein